MGRVSILALGEAAIAAVALLLVAYEAWLYVRRRRPEHLVVASGSLIMAIYAIAMGLHFDANPEEAVWLSRVEALAFVLIGHLAPIFADTTARRRFPLPRAALGVSLVFWLTMIPWLAPADLVAQPMMLLDHPFPRVEPTPLYAAGVFWALVLTGWGVVWSARHGRQTAMGRPALAVAIAVWATTGIHDALVPALGLPFATNLFEYGFCVVAVTIVARDAARYMELLDESEKDFRGLIGRAPIAIFISCDDRIVYANTRGAALVGARPGGLLRRPLRALVRHDDLEALQALIQRRDPGPIEVRLRGDGVDLPCEVFAAPTRYDDRPASVLLARDLSLTRALTARKMEADRLISVGAVAAAAGHEINNPLSYVILHLEAAREELAAAPTTSEGALDKVESALGGAERIAELLRAIGFFSRPHEDDTVFDLGDVIASAVALTANEVRHAARLSQEVEAELYVHGNATKVGQVFVNLLTNAAQAMDQPGGQITVRAWAEGDQVICEVTDDGPGIPPAIIARIFEPFFSTKKTGSGIGLDIARETVRAAGGDLAVTSEPGEGATFTVTLPRSEARPSRISSVLPSVHPPRRAKLLVVDDEREIVKALSRALRGDAEVATASSMSEAVEAIERAGPYDLVLSDLMMPDGSGMQLFERVEERWPDQARRMAFMTGGAFSASAQAFRDAIDNPILDKPIDLNHVRELLLGLVDEPDASAREAAPSSSPQSRSSAPPR